MFEHQLFLNLRNLRFRKWQLISNMSPCGRLRQPTCGFNGILHPQFCRSCLFLKKTPSNSGPIVMLIIPFYMYFFSNKNFKNLRDFDGFPSCGKIIQLQSCCVAFATFWSGKFQQLEQPRLDPGIDPSIWKGSQRILQLQQLWLT